MADQKTRIETLKDFLFLRAQNKQINEPWNYAINFISHEVRFFHLQSEYASEICRVLKELKITTTLLKKTPEGLIIETGLDEEDLILYLQGVILHLTHQLKDKTLKLIYFLMEGEETTEAFEKLICDDDLSLADLMKYKSKEIEKAALTTLLKVWHQDSKSGIGVSLRKRTNYHHRISTLSQRKTLQDYKWAKLMLENSAHLSQKGIDFFSKLKGESFKKWHKETIKLAKNTLAEIESNIESIVSALMNYYDLKSFSPEEVAIFTSQYSKMLESFEIKNETSIENIPQEILKLTREGIPNLPLLGEKVEAIYMVGSIPRKEHDPRWSDANIIIIISDSNNLEAIQEVHKKIMENKPEIQIKFIPKNKFLDDSEASTKNRFICKFDGLVIYGTDLLKDEQFPQSGMNLALLLNFDLEEDIKKYKKWLEENPNPSEAEIKRLSLTIAKRTIDFFFGIAITNNPFYTSNRMKRIKHINEQFPENRKITDQYKQILEHSGVRTREEIEILVDALENKEKTLKHMKQTKSEIEAKRKK